MFSSTAMRVPQTLTYPGYVYRPRAIISLGIYGTDKELKLPTDRTEYCFGRDPECALRTDNPHASRRHAHLVHTEDGLQLTDISSGKNVISTYGYATNTLTLRAGDIFNIGDVAYCAFTIDMSVGRKCAAVSLGPAGFDIVDNLLILAAKDPQCPFLLIGEPGNNQQQLGEIIHQCSLRRSERYVVIEPSDKPRSDNAEKIISARGGTLLIWLPTKTKLDDASVEALLSPDLNLRVIICTHAAGKATASIPLKLLSQARRFDITPLRERQEQILELFDYYARILWSDLSTSKLTAANRRALLSYDWPGNLEELRGAVANVRLLTHYRSERQASQDEADVTRSKLRAWRKRLNITLPINGS